MRRIERSIYIRFVLDFAKLYPAAFLCLWPMRGQLKNPKRTAWMALGLVTAACLVFAAICTALHLQTNALLLPALIPAFLLLRRSVDPVVSPSQTAFVFLTATMLMGVGSLVASVLNARAEVGNTVSYSTLVSTGVISLILDGAICAVYSMTISRWYEWMLREFHVERVWRLVWPLPAIYTVFLIFVMPWNPETVLLNRIQPVSLLGIGVFLFGQYLILYQLYRVAQEYTRNLQLNSENQMLAAESRRYTELRNYMEETRHLRHDFRQHLHVIAGLAESGETDKLRDYLHQYVSELSVERPTLCANAAVDAIAGHYDLAAAQRDIPIEWHIELPRELPMPEADLCMMLGNLLENALRASAALPPEQRRVQVICRMLSPAMMGISVENRYNGKLKREGQHLLSTKAEEGGIGLISVETTAQKYNGKLTLETDHNIFCANVLLNL